MFLLVVVLQELRNLNVCGPFFLLVHLLLCLNFFKPSEFAPARLNSWLRHWMQSSPVKNVMYPIWAIWLLLAAGCSNAVKVYELSENKQWKRSILNYLQYSFYVALICGLLMPGRVDYSIHMEDKRLTPFDVATGPYSCAHDSSLDYCFYRVSWERLFVHTR